MFTAGLGQFSTSKFSGLDVPCESTARAPSTETFPRVTRGKPGNAQSPNAPHAAYPIYRNIYIYTSYCLRSTSVFTQDSDQPGKKPRSFPFGTLRMAIGSRRDTRDKTAIVHGGRKPVTDHCFSPCPRGLNSRYISKHVVL